MLLPILAQLFDVLVDDLFQEGIKPYPNIAHRLASIYENSRKHEDFLAAANEFEKLVQCNQASADDYRTYGIIHQYMLKVCTENAAAYFDKAMALSKDTDPELYYRTKRQKHLFRTYIGQTEACIAEQELTAAETPANLEEQSCLLSLYLDAKQYEKGYALVTKLTHSPLAQTSNTSSIIYCCGGDICSALKKYDEAFEYWQKGYEADPRYLDALFSTAFCHEELKDYKKAYEAWNRIAAILQERGLDIDARWPMEMAEKCKEKISM